MRRIFNILGYSVLSVLLFFGGVSINSTPSGDRDRDFQVTQTDIGDSDDPDNADDSDNGDSREDSLALNPDEEEAPHFLYYYSLLDDEKKSYYDQIRDAASAEEKSVTLNGIVYENALPILRSVINDHPEYFWLDNSYSYQSGTDFVTFLFDYNCTDGEKENKARIIQQHAGEIINGIPKDSSDYEKVKYVFETIVDQTQYDKSAPDNQNIYSVFGNRSSVCAGYAKAAKYLLDQMNVDCIYVEGDAGEPHAWNIVNCDGSYYCLDTTWGDPVYQESISVNVDTTSYEYLCCTTEMLSRTHTPDAIFPVPECTDTSLEYYRMQGRYLTSAEQGPILDIMKADIDQNADHTCIQFSDPDVFGQVMAEINPLLDQAMGFEIEKKNVDSVNINYQYNDYTCLLSVYW